MHVDRWTKAVLSVIAGTMRIVDLDGKSPEYPKVKVQIRWQ